MKNKNVQFALVGTGRMGKRWAPVISNFPNILLSTVVSKSKISAQTLASSIANCTSTNNLDSVLNNSEIDAVVISTPHTYLSPITRKALLAGKHVLCEKPGAIKSSDIKRNATLAKKKGLAYMVGYNHRFHDGFIKARKYYDKGTIGEVIFIRARYGFGGRGGYDKEWRLDTKINGGGHLIDMGVHMIDLALSYLGSANKVQGMTGDIFWKKGAEDNGFVLLQNKNKAIASIHTSLTQWDRLHNFEIYGTKGYLSIKGLGMKYSDDGEKLEIGIRSSDYTSTKKRVVKCNSIADDSLSLELREFVSAIKKGRETSPSPQDAYETLKVVEKVYRSNKL